VRRPAEHLDLVSKRQILQAKLMVGSQPRQQVAQERQNNREHGS
jgi:hypothetical protein